MGHRAQLRKRQDLGACASGVAHDGRTRQREILLLRLEEVERTMTGGLWRLQT